MTREIGPCDVCGTPTRGEKCIGHRTDDGETLAASIRSAQEYKTNASTTQNNE